MEITNRSTSYAVFNLKLQSVFGGEEVGNVGGATLETVRAYVDAQVTEEHARKKGKALQQAPFARPHPGLRLEWGMRSHLFKVAYQRRSIGYTPSSHMPTG
jgi:hypothetical protein